MIDGKLYIRYMSDKQIQRYNSEIEMLMRIVVPMWCYNKDSNFEQMYPPDHAYEIKRIMSLRDKYIQKEYPELIYNERLKK